MRPVLSFIDSMTGRIFMLVAAGMLVSALAAFLLAEANRKTTVAQWDLDRSVDRIEDIILVLGKLQHPDELIAVAGPVVPGITRVQRDFSAAVDDPTMTKLLTDRISGAVANLNAKAVDPAACGPPYPINSPFNNLRCWLVSFELQGQPLRFLFSSPPHRLIDADLLSPLSFSLLFACSIVLMAYLAARMAATPLHRLAQAAERLGRDINEPSLLEQGSAEVRQAARAFNRMQVELQQTLSRRTQMLAAITHDLQTPLTRLRLRLEIVNDAELRTDLIDDLAEMQSLISEGLELARLGHGNNEPMVCLDVRSLLTCIVEDDYGLRQTVQLADCCDSSVMARPQSLRRCLNNLIDNALKHAGSATLRAEYDEGLVRIEVMDEGPGLPEDQIDAMFEPFVRLDESRSRDTGGSGLGLTIARALAEQNGGVLTLTNRPTGGLCASLAVPAVTSQHAS